MPADLQKDRALRRQLKDSVNLLLSRKFGTFFAASLLSNLGTWAQQIAEPWLLLSIGASPFLIGLDNFALSAPFFALTLLGGVFADLGDRRRVITFFQSIQMLCPAALTLLLVMGKPISPWLVIGLSTVVGITDALSMPAFQSIVPLIVAREYVGAGITLNSIQFNLSRLLGPALAGELISTFGPIACFAANTISFLPFIGLTLWILPRADGAAKRARNVDRRTLLASTRQIVRDSNLRVPLLSVLASSTFCAPVVAFLPVLVQEAFQNDIQAFTTGVTAFGAGGVMGALVLLLTDEQQKKALVTISASLFGVAVALVGVNTRLLALPVLLFICGATMTGSNIAANTHVQSAAPPHLRGRAVSIYMLALRGGLAIGCLALGGLIHLSGVRLALILAGTIGALLQVGLMRFRT